MMLATVSGRSRRCDHRRPHEVQNEGVSTKNRPRPRRLRFSGARLDLGEGVVRAGDELLFTVANRGRRDLLAGAGYGFERRTALVWRPVHINQAFVAVGFPISPGGHTRELSAEVPEDLRPERDGSSRRVVLTPNARRRRS
jgi:hypothetical protein